MHLDANIIYELTTIKNFYQTVYVQNAYLKWLLLVTPFIWQSTFNQLTLIQSTSPTKNRWNNIITTFTIIQEIENVRTVFAWMIHTLFIIEINWINGNKLRWRLNHRSKKNEEVGEEGGWLGFTNSPIWEDWLNSITQRKYQRESLKLNRE